MGALRNWIWVYAGNLIGSLAYAVLFYLAITGFGTSNGAALGDQLRKAAQAKTLAYRRSGPQAGGPRSSKRALQLDGDGGSGPRADLPLDDRQDRRDVAADRHVLRAGVRALDRQHVRVPAGSLLGAPVSFDVVGLESDPGHDRNISAGVLLTGFALAVAFPHRDVPRGR